MFKSIVKKPYQFVRKTYLLLSNGIIFIPSVIAFSLTATSVLMMYVERLEIGDEIKELVEFGLVSGADNARFMLNSFIGGIISLMVFNFSMVMVVLNQAATAFSPRVVPGVLTNKSHQLVLGVYLGTILYCLLIIVNLEKSEGEMYIPQLSIFVGMCLGIISLGLFVYFIHSISQAVQVDNIIVDLYKKTLSELTTKDKDSYYNYQMIVDKTKDWQIVKSREGGYFRDCDRDKLKELAEKNNLEVFIDLQEGSFLVEGSGFFKVNKEIDADLEEKLLKCFLMYDNEYIEDNYTYGIKQLHEIAVKALSPGINDPETAIRTINYLALIFIEKAKREGVFLIKDKSGAPRIWEESFSLYQLLYRYTQPILHYGKNDVMVVARLFYMIKCLLLVEGIHLNKVEINSLLITYSQAVQHFEGQEKNYLNSELLELNKLLKKYNYQVPIIE